MRILIPAGQAEADLTREYSYPEVPPGQRWLRANVITSVDGAAVDAAGSSRDLSGPADRTVLGVLRRLADVIVVGAGTVRAEPTAYRGIRPGADVQQRRASAGQAPAPKIAIVTGSLDLDLTGPPFQDTRPMIITAGGARLDRIARAREVADVLIGGDGTEVDPAALVTELVRAGLPRILCEGGPRLLGTITAADLLDELCLTVSPRLAGAGERARILAGPAGLPGPPRRLRLAHLLEEDGFLFARYTRPPSPAAPTT